MATHFGAMSVDVWNAQGTAQVLGCEVERFQLCQDLQVLAFWMTGQADENYLSLQHLGP